MADGDVVKYGAYTYEDGTRYIGDWNPKGQKHGMGHLVLPDNTRYDGAFQSGLFGGLGVLRFPDGANPRNPRSNSSLSAGKAGVLYKEFFKDLVMKYEGEFMQGWFHGHGIFWRADGMKFEGEFRGGRVWGLGVVTFKDGSQGFPRNEGFFQDCRFVRKKKCPEVVHRAQKVAMMARAQCDTATANNRS